MARVAGNATITIYDGSKDVTFEIWIQSVSTSSQNEFMTQQVRDGISWIPIRRAEMFFNFTIAWPFATIPDRSAKPDRGFEAFDTSDGFGKLNYFQNTIRKHQLAIARNATSKPMVLNYYNSYKNEPGSQGTASYNELLKNNVVWNPSDPKATKNWKLDPITVSGWIQQADMEYKRFNNVLYRNYTMNILQPNTAATPLSSMQNSITYAPTAASQHVYGFDWVNINNLAAAADAITIQGIPKQ